MLQWAWSYVTYERAAWLITGAYRVVRVPSMEYAERARSADSLAAEETPQEPQALGKRSA